MPNDQLEKRWNRFVEAVQDEVFNREGRMLDLGAGLIEADFATLTLRLRKSDANSAWFPRTFSREQILTGHLGVLTRAFYKEYQAERESLGSGKTGTGPRDLRLMEEEE
jgi:hypothetical protein